MTRLGLIARADNRGLGQQTWSVYRALKPHKTLVVNVPSQQPLPLRMERFPNSQVAQGFPTRADIEQFLDGVDVVYTAETGYGQHLWDVAEERGIRTVLHVNYEFWNVEDRPTVWAAPTLWHLEDLPAGTVHLPVPIEEDRLHVYSPPPVAKHFLHIVGRPAIHDRNGTPDLFDALQYVRSNVAVTVACQQRGYAEDLQRNYRIPANVTVTIRSTDVANYWENFFGSHAVLMPRRFGGLCLPAQEAVGSGLPVIMPDVSPNGWLPSRWLVPAYHAGSFQAKQPVDLYNVDPKAFAEKIDRLAQDQQFYYRSYRDALRLRENLSWRRLRARYERVLGL
jgi:glycosyltransferase involved in cell wall biosynthesis